MTFDVVDFVSFIWYDSDTSFDWVYISVFVLKSWSVKKAEVISISINRVLNRIGGMISHIGTFLMYK